MTKTVDENYIWKIIGNFFKKKGLVYQQIEHFNHYINRGIQEVINEEDNISIPTEKGCRYEIKFGAIYIYPPSIIEEDRSLKLVLPHDARRRDLDYDAAISCDILETRYEEEEIVEQKEHKRVIIGRTPIMLRSGKCNLNNMTKNDRIKSGECEYDSGGYFIIKGNEKSYCCSNKSKS